MMGLYLIIPFTGIFEWNFLEVIFKLILGIDGRGVSYEIALRLLLLGVTDDKLALVQIMAWLFIAWANVDPVICHHMASLGHDLLTYWGRVTHICVS